MRFKFLYKISDVYFCLCSFFIVIIVFGGWKNVLVQFIPYRSIFSTVWSFCFKRTPFFEFLCFFVLFKASFGCSLMYKYKMLIFFCPVHVRVPWAARGGRAGCQAQFHLHRPLQVDRAHPPPPLDNNTKSDGQQQHHHPIDSSQHVLPQS